MQLTNIARDVGEDACEGRLYLPLRWLRDAGIEPDAWLGQPVFSAALGAVVQRLLDEADSLYARSCSGIAGLPLACRPGIHAARLLYAEIGREIERRGCNSISSRAMVSWQRKVMLLLRSLAILLVKPSTSSASVLAEAQFLIDAVAHAPVPSRAAGAGHGRLVWLIELFERLERDDRLQRSRV
jgi:15-cis-phytoene synthase